MMILSFPAGVVKLNTPSQTERLFQKEETRVISIIPPIYGAASITWSRARFWAMSSAACGCSSKKKPQHIWQVLTWFYGLVCIYLHSAAPYATFLFPSFFFLFSFSCSSVLILGVFIWLEKGKLFFTLSQFPEWRLLKISEISQHSWESYSLPFLHMNLVLSLVLLGWVIGLLLNMLLINFWKMVCWLSL